MESILVHPENAGQLKAVKAFLKALKVNFEQQPKTFPPHVLRSIEKSGKQHEAGQTISLQEFKEKHLNKKKDILKHLSDGFIPEKTADEIVSDLKTARNFTRETESF